MENILSMLIFFPAAAAIVGFLIDKDSMRQYGVVVTVVEFVLSLLLWYYFDPSIAGMQFVQSIPLVSTYGINYLVGVDGVSLFLVVMITFMAMISVIGLTEKKGVKKELYDYACEKLALPLDKKTLKETKPFNIFEIDLDRNF